MSWVLFHVRRERIQEVKINNIRGSRKLLSSHHLIPLILHHYLSPASSYISCSCLVVSHALPNNFIAFHVF